MTKKKRIYYDLLFSKVNIAYNFTNIIIFNEFIEYSEIRSKKIGQIQYACGRKNVLSSLPRKDTLTILVLTGSKFSTKHNYSFFLKNYINKEIYDVVLYTNNVGQDIGAYAAALDYLICKGFNSNFITLLNSSQFISRIFLDSFLDLEIPCNNLAGISYGIGPRFQIIKNTHLQSYLLKSSFQNIVDIFNILAPNLLFYSSKYKIISEGEIAISTIAKKLYINLLIYSKTGTLVTLISKKSFFSYDHRYFLLSKDISK